MSFLGASLTDDLGSSAMSFSTTLKTLLSSITPDTAVVISISLSVVIFSVFFIKSVNIWNLSSSDILLGVVTAVGSATVTLLLVVSAGGSVNEAGVVKGVNFCSFWVVLKIFWGLRRMVGRGLNLRGKDGRRGLNLFLFLKNFCLLVSISLSTSLRSVSSFSSSLSLCSSPNLGSLTKSLPISVESSSISGTKVLPTLGLVVVDRRREKIFRILS